MAKEPCPPNATSKNSEGRTLNNTLGSLQIRGTLDKAVDISADRFLKIDLQYLDGESWVTDKTLVSKGVGTVDAGDLFLEVIAPDEKKRFFRLQIVSDFDASGATITCPIELIPR